MHACILGKYSDIIHSHFSGWKRYITFFQLREKIATLLPVKITLNCLYYCTTPKRHVMLQKRCKFFAFSFFKLLLTNAITLYTNILHNGSQLMHITSLSFYSPFLSLALATLQRVGGIAIVFDIK